MTGPFPPPPQADTPLFPGFFLGGFECSTPINAAGIRIDEIALTGHDRYVADDYRRLHACGIRAARDGIRWHLIDRAGKLDFSSALPVVAAAQAEQMTVIWDLFHYGYPDDLDPFAAEFTERFCAYCEAFAHLLVRHAYGERGRAAQGVRYYTPVNEISFFAWAGGDMGIFAPFGTGRGAELKRALAGTAIAGIDAIRRVDPLARIVNCDPVVRVVAPSDAPWLEDEANYFNETYVCEGWDMLAGRVAPELGGSPAHLDIVGVNYYGVNQWEHKRPGNVLADDDPRRVPFADLICWVHGRYGAPMLVSETSSCGDDRPRWLEMAFEECLLARASGADLHGLCVYPIVGMADWQTCAHVPMGVWQRSDVPPHPRAPHEPSFEALCRLQRRADSVWRRGRFRSRARAPLAA